MIKRLIGVIGAAAALAVFATPAHADQPKSASVTTPMHIVGYDRAVAEAHGYTIKTDAQGREYSVKSGSNVAVVTPNTTISGNCGSSTVTFVNIGNHQAKLGTSFALSGIDGYAVDFHWHVDFIDNYGASYKEWGGGLDLRRTWAGSFTFTSRGAGIAWAELSTGSFAILEDGGVCYSGGPVAETNIT